MGRTVSVSGDNAAASDSGFPVFPAGEYIALIMDFKPSPYGFAKVGANKGKPANNVSLKFIESGTGEGIGKKFTAFRVPDFAEFASGSSAFQFYQFYKALGVVFPGKGETFDVDLPDEEDIIGSEIGVRLVIDDGDKPRNSVAGWFDPAKGVVESAASGNAGDTAEDFEL